MEQTVHFTTKNKKFCLLFNQFNYMHDNIFNADAD